MNKITVNINQQISIKITISSELIHMNEIMNNLWINYKMKLSEIRLQSTYERYKLLESNYFPQKHQAFKIYFSFLFHLE